MNKKNKKKKYGQLSQTTSTPIERRMEAIEEQTPDALVWNFFVRANTVMSGVYNEFKGRSLTECINLWQTRFNGYSVDNPDLMFLNFSRSVVISYVAKVAANTSRVHISATNTKRNSPNRILGEILTSINNQTLINEGGDRKYRDTCLSATVKGTAITYEGYRVSEVEDEEVETFDALTGEYTTVKRKRIIYDDVYQEDVPVENFMITNPYINDIQMQPAILWRKLMSMEEFLEEFQGYGSENIANVMTGVLFGSNNGNVFYGNNNNNVNQSDNQVEVIRFYHRLKNRHIIIAGAQCIYDGPMPFKHRKYPFSKAIFEPATTNFFWGISLIEKIKGEQDNLNGIINMMDEKTRFSLKPFILSSDDDLTDQEDLDIGQIKKVGNIDKYVIKEMPGVNAGESNYFNQIQSLLKELAGTYGGADSFTKNGGKLDIRQIMLQQEEANATITFSSSYLEDHEVDRTKQRLYNIMQFYAIPRVERYTDEETGQKYAKLTYKNVQIDPESPAGASSTNNPQNSQENPAKSIYFQNNPTEEERNQAYDSMEQAEMLAESQGVNLKTYLVDAQFFDDHTFDVKVQRASSWMKNQSMTQQLRLEYAQYILNMVQQAAALGQDVQIDLRKVLEYVNESFDVPISDFTAEQPAQGIPGQAPQALPGAPQAPQSPQLA